MTDFLSPTARSALMARIRQKNTAPEIAVRRFLHAVGMRFRLHPRNLPGRPDIVLPKHRSIVFVHGCYWHGHSCRAGKAASSNTEYWGPKIADNRSRDARKTAQLEAMGWRVFTVWECETKGSASSLHLTRLARSIVQVPPLSEESR